MDAVLRKEIIKTRYEANKAILTILTSVVDTFPDWRFQQILQNTELVSMLNKDLFYEESLVTLEKMLNNCLVNSVLSNE